MKRQLKNQIKDKLTKTNLWINKIEKDCNKDTLYIFIFFYFYIKFTKKIKNYNINENESINLQLVNHDEGFVLKYAGLKPGDYLICLYDLQGKSLMNHEIKIEQETGKAFIKKFYNMQSQLCLFQLKTSQGFSFTGKQALTLLLNN